MPVPFFFNTDIGYAIKKPFSFEQNPCICIGWCLKPAYRRGVGQIAHI
jgi:hypothetical protein